MSNKLKCQGTTRSGKPCKNPVTKENLSCGKCKGELKQTENLSVAEMKKNLLRKTFTIADETYKSILELPSSYSLNKKNGISRK